MVGDIREVLEHLLAGLVDRRRDRERLHGPNSMAVRGATPPRGDR
jgi:hypothetical protein